MPAIGPDRAVVVAGLEGDAARPTSRSAALGASLPSPRRGRRRSTAPRIGPHMRAHSIGGPACRRCGRERRRSPQRARPACRRASGCAASGRSHARRWPIDSRADRVVLIVAPGERRQPSSRSPPAGGRHSSCVHAGAVGARCASANAASPTLIARRREEPTPGRSLRPALTGAGPSRARRRSRATRPGERAPARCSAPARAPAWRSVASCVAQSLRDRRRCRTPSRSTTARPARAAWRRAAGERGRELAGRIRVAP